MRQSLASQSFTNNEKLFKGSQESYSTKNQDVFLIFFSFSFFYLFMYFFFSFLVSNANTNRVILSDEQWQVCIGSVLRFFVVATVYFSHITSVTTLFLGRLSRLIGLTSDNCLFLSVKKCAWSVSTNYMWPGQSRTSDPWIRSQTRSTLGDSAAMYTWAAAWQNLQNGHCAQQRHRSPVHPPTLVRVFAVCMKKTPKNWVLSYPLSALRSAKTLIRLGGCPGWSESSLGTKAILLVAFYH